MLLFLHLPLHLPCTSFIDLPPACSAAKREGSVCTCAEVRDGESVSKRGLRVEYVITRENSRFELARWHATGRLSTSRRGTPHFHHGRAAFHLLPDTRPGAPQVHGSRHAHRKTSTRLPPWAGCIYAVLAAAPAACDLSESSSPCPCWDASVSPRESPPPHFPLPNQKPPPRLLQTRELEMRIFASDHILDTKTALPD